MKDQIVESVNYVHRNGADRLEIAGWKWPGQGTRDAVSITLIGLLRN